MKANRLDKYCRGWTGQKYARKLATRTRRMMERAQIRNNADDVHTPKVCAKGYCS
jgi:hypothetical protein